MIRDGFVLTDSQFSSKISKYGSEYFLIFVTVDTALRNLQKVLGGFEPICEIILYVYNFQSITYI